VVVLVVVPRRTHGHAAVPGDVSSSENVARPIRVGPPELGVRNRAGALAVAYALGMLQPAGSAAPVPARPPR